MNNICRTLLLFAIPTVLGAKLCIMYEATEVFGGLHRQGPVCSENEQESEPLHVADDTGWLDQHLALMYEGPGKVCMKFEAPTNPWWPDRSIQTDWVCSEGGVWSEWITLGDDSGWRDQTLSILSSSNGTACFRHQRYSPSHGPSETGLVCSDNSNPNSAWIGDDTGYRRQRLSVLLTFP